MAAFLFGAICGAVGCFIFMGEEDPGGWDIEELIGPDPYDYATEGTFDSQVDLWDKR